MNVEHPESSSNVVTVKLRISPELRDWIAQSAKTHNRSMNADMALRLEQSFTSSSIQSASTDVLLAELTSRFNLLGIELNLLKLNLDERTSSRRIVNKNRID